MIVGKFLKSGDAKRIEMAVADAEKMTDGEIVPMLVQSSTNTGSVRMILSLLLFCFFILVEHEFDSYFWDDSSYFLIPLSLILFYLLAGPLSKILFLQKWLTTKNDQINDVNLRAEVEFYRGQYHQTQKKSAILLFVSFMEKRAVVLADESVASKVKPEEWNEVVRLITSNISSDELAVGLIKAIQKSGEILSRHMPVTNAVKNEVRNHLIIKN